MDSALQLECAKGKKTGTFASGSKSDTASNMYGMYVAFEKRETWPVFGAFGIVCLLAFVTQSMDVLVAELCMLVSAMRCHVVLREVCVMDCLGA